MPTAWGARVQGLARSERECLEKHVADLGANRASNRQSSEYDSLRSATKMLRTGAFIGGEQFFDHAPLIPRRLRHFPLSGRTSSFVIPTSPLVLPVES